MKVGSSLLALVAAASALSSPITREPEGFRIVKSIMHPKKWRNRQARNRMQKASRKRNRS